MLLLEPSVNTHDQVKKVIEVVGPDHSEVLYMARLSLFLGHQKLLSIGFSLPVSNWYV